MKQISHEHLLEEFQGRTLYSLRPRRPDHTDGKPHVELQFRDGSQYEIHAKLGVFFEGALINTLRKAQPVAAINIEDIDDEHDARKTYVNIEFACETFTLFALRARLDAIHKYEPDMFPFLVLKIKE